MLAAWLVLRGVVDVSEGRSPLYSILGAMFLLSIATTQALLQGWNSGTKSATADVLAGLWTYTASRILPVAAGLAIIGAILNFAFGKPAMRLICHPEGGPDPLSVRDLDSPFDFAVGEGVEALSLQPSRGIAVFSLDSLDDEVASAVHVGVVA